ncbi:alkaline phosphatase [Polaribacter vadi]|uniref:alkaline phosphatase n=1 Tax=Polaribacter TaxID=52959 RepID=UPI001C086CB3|nr:MULTISPECIES: alkaline phosphatase [Polaribacter]MBU3013098.1 alkaline phosphatase [Polaribacter vadi]MDO6742918.1 alkaline phosphatase [Polaribacter sp. 1_MG-2023]
MKNNCKLLLAFLILLTGLNNKLVAQKNVTIHSHNDYKQSVPFWNAFANGATSFEADIFLKDSHLFVAHDLEDIRPSKTLVNLYLKPIENALKLEYQKDKKIILLIDIKSEAEATLNKLVTILKKHPTIINNKNIQIIISGNRPKAEEYVNYPDFIFFDYQELGTDITSEIWNKIGMVSLNFKRFSEWNGKGRLTHNDEKRVVNVIAKAKKTNKPFRFWASPDSKRAWRVLSDMGVDIINTDHPFKCVTYFKTLSNRVVISDTFSDVYHPTFKADQKDLPVKNIILLIGDGNGLAQISSTALVNNGELSLTQLKSIGFIKTQAADDFTTDSAAAGTALATGVKTNNRAIGTDVHQKPIKNITEILNEQKFSTACISTDNILGATPASFYAHAIDRSDDPTIAKDLINSKLNLFIGGGGAAFKDSSIEDNFNILSSISDLKNITNDKVGIFMSEHGMKSIRDGRGNMLADATKFGLEFLNKKNQPFFVMIEAAKIDHAGHSNDTAGILAESIDFDKAISEALIFADNNPETLVIITADHETSGFSIPQGDVKKHEIEGYFASYDHTAIMVPIFAYGAQSKEFQGVYENNEVFHKILKVLKK